MSENVIETERLTVYYGKHRGIEDVDLSVQRGEVFGFLGPNGAGKSTTQRVLLDVIRPSAGRATIFGLDCRKQGSEIRQRVGYLPGELSLYRNMTADGFLNLLQSINDSKQDKRYRQRLYERLDLDPTRTMDQYSRGNKQKVGLIAAFMGKPDLLILDEPTGGLDPLVQQTVLEMVREAKVEGRTVFFSSHILPEVEAVCDRVGIIRDGKMLQTSRIEGLIQRQFKRLSLTLRETPPTDTFAFDGVTETGRDGNTIRLEIRNHLEQVLATALPYGVEDIDVLPVTLEETFLAFYGHQKWANQHG